MKRPMHELVGQEVWALQDPISVDDCGPEHPRGLICTAMRWCGSPLCLRLNLPEIERCEYEGRILETKVRPLHSATSRGLGEGLKISAMRLIGPEASGDLQWLVNG